MRLALVITTYNRPDALRAVLDAYCLQSDPNFELIVADDGSTQPTRDLVEGYRTGFRYGFQHVWHDDRGFRAAAIRNRACLATEADYIVFTDGDCIPGRDFIAAHKSLAAADRFVAGNRILLSEKFTQRVLAEPIHLQSWSWQSWLLARWRGDINRMLPLIRLSRDSAWRDLQPMRWKGVKTCNLALWRKDLLAVNGFEESYEGWGLEDTDLVIRLLRNGQKHRSGRFLTSLFHLWHPENDRSRLKQNQMLLDQLLKATSTRAQRGLEQSAVSASS